MATAVQEARIATNPIYQAYRILHAGFTALPIIAGLDKFFHLLVNGDMYLAPVIARLSPIQGHTLMLLVGVIEVVAGILVAIKPRIGAYVVAAWLWGNHFRSVAGLRLLRCGLARFWAFFGGISPREIECRL
jgi:hypothetical protein